MIICGFIAILLMGVTLGLLGAGGSILTVPILVYLFDTSPTLATSYSLLLVGFTALAGSYFYFIKPRSVNKKLIYAAISYYISTGKKYSCTI